MENAYQKQLNINHYLRIFYRGRWIVFICISIMVAFAVVYNITTMPTYEATAMIMVKNDNDLQKAVFNDPAFGPENRLLNHIEILKSRTLAKEVVRRLLAMPQADTLIFLGNSRRNERFSFIRRFFATLGLISSEKQAIKPTFEQLVKSFQKSSITLRAIRQTDMIELKVRAYDPFEAALIVNTWMEADQDLDLRASKGEITEVRQFLENKLEDIGMTLGKSEDALKEYKQSEGLTELNTETQQMIRQMADFEAIYQEAKTGLEANERRLSFLKSQLDENQQAMLTKAAVVSSSVIQQLEKQMAELIAEKAAYEQQLRGAGYVTTSDSKFRQMEQRLKGLQKSLAEEKHKLVSSGGSALNPLEFAESLINSILQIEAENKSLQAKANAYNDIIQQNNLNLNSLPEKSLKLARFQREAEVNNRIFMMLREKFEESRIKEAGQIGSIRIVDYADAPRSPVHPKKTTNLILSIVCGLGLGVGILFIREDIDTTLKSIEDIESLGLPVLGSIPIIMTNGSFKNKDSSHKHDNSNESKLITHLLNNSSILESYQTLRTNILYSKADKPIKTLLVTSPGQGEGKSTSAANLAITFAQMGAKTLLIDSDLRRPVLNNLFGCRRNEGLTNVLVGESALREVVKRTHVKNLFMLTSGTVPKNPLDFISSKTMQKLIDKMANYFDFILLDSPPVIAVTDSIVMASKLDGVILVIRSEKTDRDAFLRSVTLLKNVNATILGVLVNRLDMHHRYGSYYKYYTYSQ